MKKTLFIAMLAVLLMGTLGSCKRASIDDPGTITPPPPGGLTGYVNLAGYTYVNTGSSKSPLGGVQVALTGKDPRGNTIAATAVSASDGIFNLGGVPVGSTGIVITPSKEQYEDWSPSTWTIDTVVVSTGSINFTGAKILDTTPPTITITSPTADQVIYVDPGATTTTDQQIVFSITDGATGSGMRSYAVTASHLNDPVSVDSVGTTFNWNWPILRGSDPTTLDMDQTDTATITIIAVDRSGNQATASVSVKLWYR